MIISTQGLLQRRVAKWIYNAPTNEEEALLIVSSYTRIKLVHGGVSIL